MEGPVLILYLLLGIPTVYRLGGADRIPTVYRPMPTVYRPMPTVYRPYTAPIESLGGRIEFFEGRSVGNYRGGHSKHAELNVLENLCVFNDFQ